MYKAQQVEVMDQVEGAWNEVEVKLMTEQNSLSFSFMVGINHFSILWAIYSNASERFQHSATATEIWLKWAELAEEVPCFLW